jgi:lactate dehydrogenase-like 2-hydroxyacid dehydrogenase
MKIVFLDAGTFYGSPDIASLLAKYGQVTLHDNTHPSEIIPRIADAEIVLTNKVVLGEEVFKSCPNLKLVCVTATGMNNIDHVAAANYNITIKNAAGYSTHSVAQTTLAMVLNLMMQLEDHQKFVATSYTTHPFFTNLNPGFSEINGKKWGIIGLGTIGKQVAKIATAMGATVQYHSPSGRIQESEFAHLSLHELLSSSDIISIHSPLNEFTKNLIGQKELALCKQSSILVNVARGGIVDELALALALDANILAGAAVDVFQSEPISASNPLLQIANKHKLLLTPHIAWGSTEARQKLIEITCQNIEAYLK